MGLIGVNKLNTTKLEISRFSQSLVKKKLRKSKVPEIMFSGHVARLSMF